MTREYYDLFEYDVALSFAAEDRSTAEELGRLLAGRSLHVFYDQYPEQGPGTESVVNHLVNLFARKARVCVVFLSQHYPLKQWTVEDRESARERAYRDPDEFVLFLQLEESEIPGTIDLRQQSMDQAAALLEEKIKRTRHRPGPPAKSHDLRSGNVPSTTRKQDEQ